MLLFLVFAFTYFFSAVLRAVTATLAPIFSEELSLDAADLGLLAGAYFFGFACIQLPLGAALDRYGPRRSILALLGVAVLGCMAFAMASSLTLLILARLAIGVGVGACLMAALTSFRRWYTPQMLLRANSWILMSGSLGMVASTLPVQWMLPHLGWRGLFWGLAGCLLMGMLLLFQFVPKDARALKGRGLATGGYRDVVRSRIFLRLAPLGFCFYGGLLAIQSLWAGPWLTRVCGWSAGQAAQGLFFINLSMLLAFLSWGSALPRLIRAGWKPQRLLAWGLPVSLLLLALNLVLGQQATAGCWAAWCVASSVVTLSQPAVGAHFSASLAGRALSAFNLAVFGGVFCMQWGLGLLIDVFLAEGMGVATAFRLALGAFGLACLAAYAWYLWFGEEGADNHSPSIT